MKIAIVHRVKIDLTISGNAYKFIEQTFHLVRMSERTVKVSLDFFSSSSLEPSESDSLPSSEHVDFVSYKHEYTF
jgi:hypothetical protein